MFKFGGIARPQEWRRVTECAKSRLSVAKSALEVFFTVYGMNCRPKRAEMMPQKGCTPKRIVQNHDMQRMFFDDDLRLSFDPEQTLTVIQP